MKTQCEKEFVHDFALLVTIKILNQPALEAKIMLILYLKIASIDCEWVHIKKVVLWYLYYSSPWFSLNKYSLSPFWKNQLRPWDKRLTCFAFWRALLKIKSSLFNDNKQKEKFFLKK